MKVGRNDPCPCGSGKKYKKCCLEKDQAENVSPFVRRERAVLEPVDTLRRKIVKFMERDECREHVVPAARLYWRTLEEDLEPEPMNDTEMLSFNEWFIHDYILPEHGKPLITVFLESNPRLTKDELAILKDWELTNLSVYQITKVEAGHGIYGEDIFTGEEFFLHDVTTSRQIKQWELLITRKVWVLNEWQLSAAGVLLYPPDKEEVYTLVMDHYREYKKEHPGATIPEFLHARGYILNHYYQTRKVKPREMPTVLTAEGGELVFHEAIYNVLNFDEVLRKLQEADEYEMVREEENGQGEMTQCRFQWLQKGRSTDLLEGKQAEKGLSLHSYLIKGPGEESSRVLGNVEVSRERLKLSTWSEERLKVGKELFVKTLGSAVKHRMDSIQTFESKMEEDEGEEKKGKERIDPEIERRIVKEMLDKHYKEWLDSEILALGNRTPRQSVKTEEGRKKVEDLLRLIEHTEERKKENGEIGYDCSWMRKELGMEKG